MCHVAVRTAVQGTLSAQESQYCIDTARLQVFCANVPLRLVPRNDIGFRSTVPNGGFYDDFQVLCLRERRLISIHHDSWPSVDWLGFNVHHLYFSSRDGLTRAELQWRLRTPPCLPVSNANVLKASLRDTRGHRGEYRHPSCEENRASIRASTGEAVQLNSSDCGLSSSHAIVKINESLLIWWSL
ncbi:hypothetical protein BC835DRAFT_853888 [Cytidiella melzeri]|nr:hypothetical protein BC835DRAFT_853888 [Cytidiella melzeri]